MKFATQNKKKGVLLRGHKRRNVFLFCFVRYANQLSHNITELVFVFYFHSVLKLQQGVLHNCNKTGLPDFFFVFFFPFDQFTSRISSRSKKKIFLQFLDVIPVIHRLLPHN